MQVWYNDIEVMKMKLKEHRIKKGLTQIDCAKYLGIPVRTYQNYENDESKSSSMKYQFMVQKLEQYGLVDETHGILSIEKIKEICASIFSSKYISYCYLFGSYAKGKATEESDIDLLISTSITGIMFYDLVEELRECLLKKVDVLNQDQLKNNNQLVNEILKYSVKIYG